MTRPASRSPVSWLGGLLVAYLAIPIAAFAVRLAGSSDRGFGSPGLWGALGTSVESATISTALIAVLGVPLAYGLARARGPFAAAIGILVQLPLALPPVMSGLVLIYIVGPYTALGTFFDERLTNSVIGIVLAQTFVAAPFLIISARSAFATVDPALDDLAATLGRRTLARFLRVNLPVAAPGIRAGLLLTWLRAFGEYGATVLVAYHPYSLPVYTYVQFSGFGIPTTQAPTALALGAAAGALVVSRARLPHRRTRSGAPVEPRRPLPATPVTVGFDLDLSVGDFRLRLAHQAASHRLAILGPSGSGKSLTLRALAGLLGREAGSVTLNGESVSGVATEDRRIGYVPQGLVLFPGLSVRRQLAFARDADEHAAAWWLDTLRIAELADRLPAQLSGGQRQRVSLAQALSRAPRLVLLDEPFSALDAPIRAELRQELRRLQLETGLSTVLVTHDPEEAALLADDVVVLADGRLLQAGSRPAVYGRPASPRVAQLLGIENLLAGTIAPGGGVAVGDARIDVPTPDLPAGTRVRWCVRREDVVVGATGPFPATVLDVVDLGGASSVTLRLAGGMELRARTASTRVGGPGTACRVTVDPGAVTVWTEAEEPLTSGSL